MSLSAYPISQFITIEIEWRGPFGILDILKGDNPLFKNIGLYQIYGDHPINGSDNLLYLGHTTKSFKERLKTHHDVWIKHESTYNQIYLGVIWENEKIGLEKEVLFIKESERLLTYFSSPPYNSSLVYDMNRSDVFKKENILVRNLWQKHRMPYEVTSGWYHSNCWNSKRKLSKLKKES